MRLIDADAIVETLKEARKKADSPRSDLDLLILQEMIQLAPTIAPSPNAPLTLEELREMDGEPVWWWNTSSKPVCTICTVDRFGIEPAFVNFDFIEEDSTHITKYDWLRKRGYKAYRRKPEEGTV